MTKPDAAAVQPPVNDQPKRLEPASPAPKMVPAPSLTPGHRRLNPHELELVNACRDLGDHCAALFQSMQEASKRDEASGERVEVDPRAAALARTHFQEALMWATRAVTKPTHF